MRDEAIVKYIWSSEGDSCEDCQALDGEEFDSIDDIPDRPHPNCDCTIQEIPLELCDCAEDLDAIQEMIGDVESAREEAESVVSYVQDVIHNIVIEPVLSLVL